MDPFDILDNEIQKMEIEKILQVFYKMEFEEYLPQLKAELKREESNAEEINVKDGWVKATKKAIQDAPAPEEINFGVDFVENVKSVIEDEVYGIVTDVLKDFLHGSREGKYRGWREPPCNLLVMGGAEVVDPEAKTALSEIIGELGAEIAKEASDFAAHAYRRQVFAEDVKIAAKRLRHKVYITEENLRALIREELERIRNQPK